MQYDTPMPLGIKWARVGESVITAQFKDGKVCFIYPSEPDIRVDFFPGTRFRITKGVEAPGLDAMCCGQMLTGCRVRLDGEREVAIEELPPGLRLVIESLTPADP